MLPKATRILHSRGLNRDKNVRLAQLAVLFGPVRKDVWQRCRGVSAAPQSPYDIRDSWMAEDYDWHGVPARLGKAVITDVLGDIDAAREGAKAPVKKAIGNRTRGDGEERHRLYSLLKQNRWTENPFLHRQMRQQWRGGRSHVTNQIVADAGSYTTKVWHGRAWNHLQSLERGQHIANPLKGAHLPSGTLRIILQANGQVAVHHAVDEEQVCSTKPYGQGTVGVDKGYAEAYTDSDGECHGEGLGNLFPAESDQRKVKGVMADTLTSATRRRGSAPALVNPVSTSQIDTRTGLLPGTRLGTGFTALTGLCWTRTPNAACNILARLYDEEITLYIPYRQVRGLLAERTRAAVGTAPPGLVRGLATPPPSTESEVPGTHKV